MTLVVEVVVSRATLPFESVAELTVVVSVFAFLPWSEVSVFLIVVESVVLVSVFWATSAAAVKSEAKISFFIRSSIRDPN